MKAVYKEKMRKYEELGIQIKKGWKADNVEIFLAWKKYVGNM